MITLPKKIIKSENKNPKKLLIISPPKRGKTTLVAGLKNCLIIDLEKGTDYVDALKIQANSLDELVEVGKAILLENDKAKKPIYDYIAIDTITKLEDIAKDLALKNYKNSAIGRNFDGDVNKFMQLPNGAAYLWVRQAFEKLYSFFSELTPCLILLGHLKRTAVMRDNAEIQATDIDLTGKLKNITCADMDAIGVLKRKDNQSILSFKTSEDDLVCGSRCEHLANQDILIAEKNESGFTYHWDKIFTND
jgi:hypothetical protein